MKSKFIPALATMVGTIIGAGFLGIPYVTGKSGFIPGAIWLIVLSLFMLLVNLYLGEVILRTKTTHQLTGYAKIYAGKFGKGLMFFSINSWQIRAVPLLILHYHSQERQAKPAREYSYQH